ncbi:SDR family oxidoreductase [Rhodobacteraceae bacterium RKSG542]|uniref:SDR family oxidoreductase n=1 Tax=Pseudovibrio flavus TaxID=2529854 RepID=UPI0012BCAD36|nr:SDR family oxidoreductase [Pseudovibrio flavus]MTI17185.1 SDR family oxidoreductase [Pseudovibrio flavus]
MTLGALLVTGGSRGIGAQVARMAAKAGYPVCINYTANDEAARRLLTEIEEIGGQAIIAQADVSREDEVVAMFDRCEAELGPLGGLVNNAGVMGRNSRLDAMDFGRIDRTLRVNVLGTMLCAREAVRRMSIANGGKGGAIVNVSSVAAKNGAAGENIDYAASKGAVEAFTIGLGKEVAGEGIRVNCVRPGMTDTELHASTGDPERIVTIAPTIPIKRVATANEIAKAIMWLLSDDASYCVGAILEAGGGR